MRKNRPTAAAAAGALMLGSVGQFGGCNFGEVTTPVSLSGEELLIALIRSAILSPIDQFITNSIQDAFDDDDEE